MGLSDSELSSHESCRGQGDVGMALSFQGSIGLRVRVRAKVSAKCLYPTHEMSSVSLAMMTLAQIVSLVNILVWIEELLLNSTSANSVFTLQSVTSCPSWG